MLYSARGPPGLSGLPNASTKRPLGTPSLLACQVFLYALHADFKFAMSLHSNVPRKSFPQRVLLHCMCMDKPCIILLMMTFLLCVSKSSASECSALGHAPLCRVTPREQVRFAPQTDTERRHELLAMQPKWLKREFSGQIDTVSNRIRPWRVSMTVSALS